MTYRISTTIFASAAVVFALAAAPALSAIQPAKEQVAAAGASNEAEAIRIVSPSQEGALGTIWFKDGERSDSALPYGGPR